MYASRHLFVAVDAEEQGDVDVDTLAGQLANRGQAFRGGRHLDHHVLAIDGLPEAPRFFDRCLGIVREIRRDFEADVPVAAFCGVVDRAKQVRRARGCRGSRAPRRVPSARHPACPLDLLQGIEVIGAAGDRLFEYRGVRCGAAKPVFSDQPAELAGS